ncbi:MAG: nitronate monooxygenase [Candidatus Omnitrophica bacterium]|nr:nitronate monooxygenase [Candidatus Omnitrophota bacterium]
MGVRVSTSSLAGAVANCGAAGTIASVGLPPDTEENRRDVPKSCREHLQIEIRKSREISPEGVIGVNIMVALSNYEDMVRTAAKEDVDFIISGAGLPLSLPEFAEGSRVKLIPMVSSGRGTKVLLQAWKRRYNRLPEALIVEGPLSGGHIGGHSLEDLKKGAFVTLETSFADVLGVAREYGDIPVVAAGGIYDGSDIAKFFRLGARGVQMGTRFVATYECSAAKEFKDVYLKARKEDVIFIQSPVGMPAKAVKTKFTEDITAGRRKDFHCSYQCLRTCDPGKVPFCIAKALINAVEGDVDNGVVFAGSNVSRVKEIVHVKELVDTLVAEAEEAMSVALGEKAGTI